MVSVRRNVIANYLGQGWSVLMSLAFIPFYIKYLGIEAYGLIGVFTLLQAWMSLLDMGITPTLNREMARFKAGTHSPESIRDLLRSMEIVYTGIALLVILIVWVISPWFAGSWLKAKNLSLSTVIQAINVMGFVVATRLWEDVYKGAIQGMQQQVWLNGVQAGLATLRWAGVLGLMAWVSPSIQVFFVWQGAVSLLSVALCARQTYKWLPDASRSGKFSLAAIRAVRRFAAGMVVTTLLALLLTQIDKLLLSKLLTLDQFGYYTLAAMLAGGLIQLIVPINAAIYPRLTELIARQDTEAVVKTFHEACQWMSAIIVPPALVLSVFSAPVLSFWIGDPVITAAAAPILSLLVLGTMFNAFMNVPYILQLAHGWTGLTVRMNMIAVLIIIPAIFWAVPRYGAIGAAWAWLALNLGYVLIGIHLMYRRLLSGQKWRWYKESVVVPLTTATAVAAAVAWIMPTPVGRVAAGVTVMIAAICVSLTVILMLSSPRHRIINLLNSWRIN